MVLTSRSLVVCLAVLVGTGLSHVSFASGDSSKDGSQPTTTQQPTGENDSEQTESEDDEDAKKGKKKKHPGDHSGVRIKKDSLQAINSIEQIKSAMKAHILNEEKNNGGKFSIKDKVTGEMLQLKFAKLHPVRKIDDKHFFACADFYVGSDQSKVYDLDFWLDVENKQLVVQKSKTQVHKHPRWSKNKWVKQARYTFVNNQPVPLNN